MRLRRAAPRFFVPVLAAVAIVAVACGGSSEAGSDDDAAAELPPIAGACLEGTVDCQDTPQLGDEPPILDGEPVGQPATGGGSTPLLVGGGLTVAELLTTDGDGPLAVRGFFYSDRAGTWLCDALAESFPPQCGGERIAFEGVSVIDPDDLDESQGVSWSAQPLTVLGSLVEGVFVATPFAQ